MSKVLVEVYVPATAERKDLLIPYEVPLSETTQLLKAVIGEDSSQGFIPSEDTYLCDMDTGAIFNINLSPEELDLRHGARLMLV